MAVYKIRDKEVTKEEFYNELLKNKIGSVMSDKKEDIELPFFLDEVIGSQKKLIGTIDMAECFLENPFKTIPWKKENLTEEDKEKINMLREYIKKTPQEYNSIEDITKVFKYNSEQSGSLITTPIEELINNNTDCSFNNTKLGEWQVTSNWIPTNTVKTIFEKVQDSTLTPEVYKKVIESANKIQEKIVNNINLPSWLEISQHFGNQTEEQKESLETYNAIVGHSTRHKAGKPEDQKTQTVSNDLRSQAPQQKCNENVLLGNSPVFDLKDSAKQIRNCLMLGVKNNEGKLPLDIMITRQFPKALEAICKATEFGHNYYKETDLDYLNYKRVEGGSQAYADALQRHSMNKAGKDEKSGLPHIYHKAWNALAELELWIEENEK